MTETSVLLVDAGQLSAAFQPPAHWSTALRSGATVIVHGARPEHRQWLSALAGKPLSLSVQPLGMWEGRAYRNTSGWLTPGLSHIDLYWKQGLAALDASKDIEARDLLQKSLTEDPSRAAAYQALGATYEKLKDDDGVLATYRAWIKAGAKSPLPYNRVGEILEKRKDYRGALEAYVRSLQVEWNQPPIIEARKRLEKLLAN